MKNVNNILKLLTWNNQSYPIGSYSFSSGLEYAVENKIINTDVDLENWLRDFLKLGNLQSDAILLVEAWRLMSGGSEKKIESLNNFALSLNQSYEKYIESSEQGKAFIKISKESWNHKFISDFLMFPIAYACSAYQEKISLEDSLISFLHSNLCNLLAAGIKLIPLGQTKGGQFFLLIRPINLVSMSNSSMYRRILCTLPQFALVHALGQL